MVKLTFTVAMLVMTLMLTACSTKPNVKTETNKGSALNESRVVAVSDFRTEITRNTPLTWYADFKIISARQTKDLPEFTRLIKEQIEKEID